MKDYEKLWNDLAQHIENLIENVKYDVTFPKDLASIQSANLELNVLYAILRYMNSKELT